MAQCQGCKGDLTKENSAPSVVERGRGMCHPCSNKRMMKYRFEDPKRFILYSTRQGAKQRGIEHKLTVEDIPNIPKRCPVFPWITLEWKVGEGIRHNSPSLDRIDNTKGYAKGNIRIISWRANVLKKDATDRELAALGEDATKCNITKDLSYQYDSFSEEIAESIGC